MAEAAEFNSSMYPAVSRNAGPLVDPGQSYPAGVVRRLGWPQDATAHAMSSLHVL